MRKLIKVAGGLLAAAVVLVSGAVGFLAVKSPAQHPAATEAFAATPERLARGKYLVEHVTPCLHCHSTVDMSVYGGVIKPGTEGMGGQAFGPSDGVPGFV